MAALACSGEVQFGPLKSQKAAVVFGVAGRQGRMDFLQPTVVARKFEEPCGSDRAGLVKFGHNIVGSYGVICWPLPRHGERMVRRAAAMPNNDRSALASTGGVTAEGAAGGFGTADGTVIKPTRSFAE